MSEAKDNMADQSRVRAANFELRSSVRCHSTFDIHPSNFTPRELRRYRQLYQVAKQPTIGTTVDDAMVATERDRQMTNAETRMWN